MFEEFNNKELIQVSSEDVLSFGDIIFFKKEMLKKFGKKEIYLKVVTKYLDYN